MMNTSISSRISNGPRNEARKRMAHRLRIFERLEHGDVPSHVVLDFARAKTKNQRSEEDQHFATADAGSARVL
jgi:hypothetical protein